MWNFLKKINEPEVKEYTAAEVHAELTAMMVVFLADIQQEIERKDTPMVVSREASLLQRLGFKRSKNAQLANQIINEIEAHNKAYKERKAALSFMQQAWATFGKDTMVVRYDKFFELLRKYNLVCGNFDRYTGTIPAENLDDIERVTTILEKDDSLVESFRYIQSVDTDGNDIEMLKHFNLYPMSIQLADEILPQIGVVNFTPILNSRKVVGESTGIGGIGPLYYDLMLTDGSRFNRGQSTADLYFQKKAIREGWGTSERQKQNFTYTGRPNLSDNEDRIFIAAPAQEMEQYRISTYSSSEIRQQQEAEERRMREIRTKDPFICSLTPFGVMIYTKWGDEAQDEIIKRYETLSKFINGEPKLIAQ